VSISTDMIVRVAHADIAMDMAFPRSVAHWHREDEGEHPWKILAGNCNAILIGKEDGVVIDGNCSNNVSAPDGGRVHIYGDLASKIEIGGHYEIVVTGNVHPGATINASGFCHVFVGGAFSGELRSSGSAKIWIGADFNGTLLTGGPSTRIHIGGNYTGSIRPIEEGSLLWMTIAGFASETSLSKIADCEYTQFHASVASSNMPVGLHPPNGHRKKASGTNSFNRWSVASNSQSTVTGAQPTLPASA
jgi:hypothetical protein